MKAPKIGRPWKEILLLAFFISMIGYCHFETVEAQQPINYVEPIWQENFIDAIENIKTQFETDVERDLTDMGIVLAQKKLEKRIYFLLSKYEFEINRERRKIEKNKNKDFYDRQAEYRALQMDELMNEDTEKLQAEEEERLMDQQGIWQDMTNNK